MKVKMVVALAFVPVWLIDVYVDALKSYLSTELEPLFEWFQHNYVGTPAGIGKGYF